MCTPCLLWQKQVWVAKTLERFDKNCPNTNEVIMWTLGTNLDWSSENIKRLKRAFELFRKRLWKLDWEWKNPKQYIDGEGNLVFRYPPPNKYVVWKPLLYVIEEGSTGKKLHYHFIIDGVVSHAFGKQLWRELIGIPNANVAYSRPKRCTDCGKVRHNKYKYCRVCKSSKYERLKPHLAFSYLTKYLSKARNSYPMGEMLKKLEPTKMSCKEIVFDEICTEDYYIHEVSSNQTQTSRTSEVPAKNSAEFENLEQGFLFSEKESSAELRLDGKQKLSINQMINRRFDLQTLIDWGY